MSNKEVDLDYLSDVKNPKMYFYGFRYVIFEYFKTGSKKGTIKNIWWFRQLKNALKKYSDMGELDALKKRKRDFELCKVIE